MDGIALANRDWNPSFCVPSVTHNELRLTNVNAMLKEGTDLHHQEQLSLSEMCRGVHA